MEYTRYTAEEIESNYYDDLDVCHPAMAEDLEKNAVNEKAFKYIIHDSVTKSRAGVESVEYDSRFFKKSVNVDKVTINLKKFIPFDVAFNLPF